MSAQWIDIVKVTRGVPQSNFISLTPTIEQIENRTHLLVKAFYQVCDIPTQILVELKSVGALRPINGDFLRVFGHVVQLDQQVVPI